MNTGLQVNINNNILEYIKEHEFLDSCKFAYSNRIHYCYKEIASLKIDDNVIKLNLRNNVASDISYSKLCICNKDEFNSAILYELMDIIGKEYSAHNTTDPELMDFYSSQDYESFLELSRYCVMDFYITYGKVDSEEETIFKDIEAVNNLSDYISITPCKFKHQRYYFNKLNVKNEIELIYFLKKVYDNIYDEKE